MREIRLSADLDGYLDFPHAHVAFRIERRTSTLDGTPMREEVSYGITSRRGTTAADAQAIMAWLRGHWVVENRLHWVRDVTFDEDRSQIRKGNGPRMMASLRNIAISVLRLAKAQWIAKAIRACGRDAFRCMRLIGLA